MYSAIKLLAELLFELIAKYIKELHA